MQNSGMSSVVCSKKEAEGFCSIRGGVRPVRDTVQIVSLRWTMYQVANIMPSRPAESAVNALNKGGWIHRSIREWLLFLLISFPVSIACTFFTQFAPSILSKLDQAFYMQGKTISHGLVPYVDFADVKGPLLLHLLALGYWIHSGVVWGQMFFAEKFVKNTKTVESAIAATCNQTIEYACLGVALGFRRGVLPGCRFLVAHDGGYDKYGKDQPQAIKNRKIVFYCLRDNYPEYLRVLESSGYRKLCAFPPSGNAVQYVVCKKTLNEHCDRKIEKR